MPALSVRATYRQSCTPKRNAENMKIASKKEVKNPLRVNIRGAKQHSQLHYKWPRWFPTKLAI